MDPGTEYRRGKVKVIKRTLDECLVHHIETSTKLAHTFSNGQLTFGRRCYHSNWLWSCYCSFWGWDCCRRTFNCNRNRSLIGVNLLQRHR